MNTLEMQQQLADQRRGRYVRVSDTDRRQLIDTYKKGEDFIALAKKLNIKRSTARSILRTYIDEGRVSAKQRAGTRLRFITEDEAEMIREMKRRHPLITIGQIQMRLQRTSNRVLSKASISRILTNSIRLGKRAKRSNGEFIDEQDGMNEFTQLSSDDGTGGGVYIDDGVDDDDDDDEQEMLETNPASQNLDDFQRFMLRKTSVNGDESMENEDLDGYDGANYMHAYRAIGSEDEDDLSETDENETKSSGDNAVSNPGTNENLPASNENDSYTQVKTEPVCVFVNRNFDSSDSEPEPTNDETISKAPVSAHSTANRRIKICPICGEQNFSRLSHHLTVAHNLNRAESLALLAYPDRNNNNTHSSIATVSGSSPINSTANQFDKSPQQTPISINTNNQQITSTHSSPSIHDTENRVNLIQSSPTEQQSANGLSIDGKKRLLCPCCDTWVLNLTDHLIKKHHLSSKQERLPFLRLARNRQSAVNGEKSSTNSFLISPLDQQQQTNSSEANKKYQNIIKKYQKKPFYSHPASSSSTLLNQESSATNSNQNLLAITNPTNSSKQISPSRSSSKDGNVHQKFEQRLSVFRQQFAVTVALQNSLMQQMELLQKSFVSIEDEWNDMKNEIVESIS